MGARSGSSRPERTRAGRPVNWHVCWDKGILGASFQFTFTNAPRTRHSVLGSTNAALAAANWDGLGSATEVSSGIYQFTDLRATHRPRSFYRVRSP